MWELILDVFLYAVAPFLAGLIFVPWVMALG
jgi:hypothetical protein